MAVIYAEDMNYWKTSTTHAETWIEKAKKEIIKIGGKVHRTGYGEEQKRIVFLMEFQLGNDQFKIAWATLPSKTNNINAAKRQAATLLYHDVKHKCVMAKIKGNSAFVEYLVLPNGQTATEAANSGLFMQLISNVIMLPAPSDKG